MAIASAPRAVAAGAIDQALVSLGNAVIVIAMARTSTAAEFGRLTFAVVAMTALNVAARGFFGTFVAVLGRAPSAAKHEASVGITLCLALSVIFGGGIHLVTSSIAGAAVMSALPALLVTLEMCRWFLVSSRRAHTALIADSVYSIGCLMLLILTMVHDVSVSSVLAGWFFTAALAMFVAARLARIAPCLRQPFGVIRSTWKERVWFGSEGLLAAWSSVLVASIVGTLSGGEALGGLRGASTLLGPLSLLLTSLPMVAVPELADLMRRNQLRRARLYLDRGVAVFFVGALAVAAFGAFCPDHVGRAFLGESWSSARPLILPLSLEQAALAVLHSSVAILRAGTQGRIVLSLRSIQVVLSLATTLVACLTVGVGGVAWGLFAVATLVASLARRRVSSIM